MSVPGAALWLLVSAPGLTAEIGRLALTRPSLMLRVILPESPNQHRSAKILSNQTAV